MNLKSLLPIGLLAAGAYFLIRKKSSAGGIQSLGSPNTNAQNINNARTVPNINTVNSLKVPPQQTALSRMDYAKVITGSKATDPITPQAQVAYLQNKYGNIPIVQTTDPTRLAYTPPGSDAVVYSKRPVSNKAEANASRAANNQDLYDRKLISKESYERTKKKMGLL